MQLVSLLKIFIRADDCKSRITLCTNSDQFISSSDIMHPSNPKRAPEAPTEMLFAVRKRADIKLPPKPEMTYSRPVLTVEREITIIIKL